MLDCQLNSQLFETNTVHSWIQYHAHQIVGLSVVFDQLQEAVFESNWDPNVRSGEFWIRIDNYIQTTIINPEETLSILVIPMAKLNGVSNLSAIFMFSTMEVSLKKSSDSWNWLRYFEEWFIFLSDEGQFHVVCQIYGLLEGHTIGIPYCFGWHPNGD